jgi:trk system potassium uptake protein TrkA
VIGLGRFGTVVARRLAEGGVQVVAIDRNPRIVHELKDVVALAVQLDATDRQALLSQDIDKVDVCVISIGENFEASLLTTVTVKQLGVPLVICRAQTQLHAEIFLRIGADQVIQPEAEAGEQIARQLVHPQLMDFVPLSEDFALIEIRAPRAFHGKSLKGLGLRTNFHVNLVAIRRDVASPTGTTSPKPQMHVPQPDDVILPNDVLVLVGPNEALALLPKE